MAKREKDSDQAYTRLLAAAGRSFRRGGYGGAGIDALAKDAGLTSGAFYAHFGSKAEAFRLTVRDGFQVLEDTVVSFHDRFGNGWQRRFVDFYLGELLEMGIAQACTLPSLSFDVARADAATRVVYETGLSSLLDKMAAHPSDTGSRQTALALLTTLSGGAAMASAVNTPVLRSQILAAAKTAALEIVRQIDAAD